jgi:tetratricopeptide (TPR) repeat protein
MRKAATFALFAAGLVTAMVALLAAPSREEKLAIALRDKRPVEAYQLLRQRKAEALSDAELLHLHRVAEELAEPEPAAEALRTYAARHPNDVDALQRLARLFRFTQQEERYRDVIGEIYAAAPTEENLEALLRMRRLDGDNQEELRLARPRRLTKLHDIARTGLLLASAGKYEEAAEMLGRLPENSFDQFRQEHLTRISLLRKLGRDREASRAYRRLTTPSDLILSPPEPR